MPLLYSQGQGGWGHVRELCSAGTEGLRNIQLVAVILENLTLTVTQTQSVTGPGTNAGPGRWWNVFTSLRAPVCGGPGTGVSGGGGGGGWVASWGSGCHHECRLIVTVCQPLEVTVVVMRVSQSDPVSAVQFPLLRRQNPANPQRKRLLLKFGAALNYTKGENILVEYLGETSVTVSSCIVTETQIHSPARQTRVRLVSYHTRSHKRHMMCERI